MSGKYLCLACEGECPDEYGVSGMGVSSRSSSSPVVCPPLPLPLLRPAAPADEAADREALEDVTLLTDLSRGMPMMGSGAELDVVDPGTDLPGIEGDDDPAPPFAAAELLLPFLLLLLLLDEPAPRLLLLLLEDVPPLVPADDDDELPPPRSDFQNGMACGCVSILWSPCPSLCDPVYPVPPVSV